MTSTLAALPGATVPGPVGGGTPIRVSVSIASGLLGCQPGVTAV
ncbi:hypothetical protein [Dactylosporangium sp. CA-233914]